MSGIYKIKQAVNTYTETELKISEYIIKNSSKVLKLSVIDLANKIGTSSAAIVRFSKKTGFIGYADLKLSLARDKYEIEEEFDLILRKTDSVENLIHKSYEDTIQNMEHTYKLISITELEKGIELIKKARRIYIIGVGGSKIICDDLSQKFLRINKDVINYTDIHVQAAAMAHISELDVLIVISYSGKTEDVLKLASMANVAGAKIISITKFDKNLLNKISDVVLHVPSNEKEMRLGAISSRFSSLVMTDLLFYGLAKDNYEVAKDGLVKTKQLADEFKL